MYKIFYLFYLYNFILSIDSSPSISDAYLNYRNLLISNSNSNQIPVSTTNTIVPSKNEKILLKQMMAKLNETFEKAIEKNRPNIENILMKQMIEKFNKTLRVENRQNFEDLNKIFETVGNLPRISPAEPTESTFLPSIVPDGGGIPSLFSFLTPIFSGNHNLLSALNIGADVQKNFEKLMKNSKILFDVLRSAAPTFSETQDVVSKFWAVAREKPKIAKEIIMDLSSLTKNSIKEQVEVGKVIFNTGQKLLGKGK